MASQSPNKNKKANTLYPQVILSNPDSSSQSQSSSNLYPKIDLVENLFPDTTCRDPNHSPSAPPEAVEEVILKIHGAILNLIDQNYSVELACGDLSVLRLRQGGNVVAFLLRVADEIQWPLAKDVASVKLDDSHYFFTLRLPKHADSSDDDDDDARARARARPVDAHADVLNYGLTIASKGQEALVKEFDAILNSYSCFSQQSVSRVVEVKEMSPADLDSEAKKEVVEGKCAAYWTTLAPNVEEYSGTAARLIASGSGQLIKGILWCGDVTTDRLVKGNEIMKKRMSPRGKTEVSPDTLKRIRRVKRMTRMTEKVATGVLSGVVKVSGLVTGSVANSKVGKKFFSLLPGEIVLASLDGFNKVCDAVEVAGKNVMSTSSTATTELVSQRYGDEAGKATNEGLDAAGHAIGTAWAVFKLRKALNPKSVLKPSTLAKSAAKAAAAEKKAGKSSK